MNIPEQQVLNVVPAAPRVQSAFVLQNRVIPDCEIASILGTHAFIALVHASPDGLPPLIDTQHGFPPQSCGP